MAEMTLAVETGVLPGFEFPRELVPAWITDADRAASEWRRVACLLSPRDEVRLSVRTPDGKKLKYPGGLHAPLAEVPQIPTAMYVFGDDGCAKVLPLDLDAKGKHTPLEAAADAAGARALLAKCRVRWIEDEGPGGGRHLLIPWSKPQPFADINRLGRALARRMRSTGWYGTIDIGPFSSVSDSLIRPPGSPHRLGGYQQLITPLYEAEAIARTGNGSDVWNRLHEELAAELEAVDAAGLAPEDVPDDVPLFPRPTGSLPLSPAMDAIARTGEFDRTRYETPSNARQAVITNAIDRGWSLRQLVAETTPGARYEALGGFYERYNGAEQRRRAWIRDWKKAYEKVAESRKFGNSSPLDLPDITRGVQGEGEDPQHPGLAGYRWTRSFLNAVYEGVRAGELTQTKRLALYALATMAMRRGGERQLRIGIRGLDLTSCLDHSTIADALRELRDEADPYVELLEPGRGTQADWYELKIPARYADAARWHRWPAGRLEAIHYVFRDRLLGPAAGLVYGGLPNEPIKTTALAAAVVIPERTVRDALRRLANVGLAEKTGPAGWRRTTVSLDTVAAELGADEACADRIDRYRAERTDWHAFLRRFDPGALEDLERHVLLHETAHEPAVPAVPEWLTESTPAWIFDPRVPAPEPPSDILQDADDPDAELTVVVPHPRTASEPTTDNTMEPRPAGTLTEQDRNSVIAPATAVETTRAGGKPRSARETQAQKRWRMLDERCRVALIAFYHADQEAEKAEAKRRGTGQISPPAAVWRAVKVDDALAAAATGGDPEQVGHIANRLDAAGLVEALIVEMLDGYESTVTLTRAGRAAAREGLGIKLTSRPKWALSEGYWRVLDQVARSAEHGVPHDKIWEPGSQHLSTGSSHQRRGRGFITQRAGRWYLTDLGAEHHAEHAEAYRQLYPPRW